MSDIPAIPGPNGGDLVVALMDALGIDTAFGVVSVHNMPLIDAISRDRRFVPVRHEAAAVNAADGYGRARGGIGLAITSTGTGAGNAAGSLIESLAAGSRVLHLTGQIETAHLGRGRGFIHETKDQFGMLTAVSKEAFTIDSLETAGPILAEAAGRALSAPTGPVSVEWPIDLQYAPAPVALPPVVVDDPVGADAEQIAAAAAALAAAERPLIWAGGGAHGARDQVEQLLTTLKAGLFTSNSGRGTVREDHGACLGNFASNPESAELLSRADVLLSIGTHFRSNETRDYSLELPTLHIQLDVDPAAVGRTYPAEIGLVGDAALTLDALLKALPDRTATDDGWLTEVARTRRNTHQQLRDAIGWQAKICDGVRAALPWGSVIARDVTIPSSTWGNRLFSVGHPRENIFPLGGGIGQGLAMGIGAAIARPDEPTLCLAGDGGLAVHLGEMLTLAQERPWMVLLLFNDRGYGVLRNTQDAFVSRRSGVDLTTPDFRLLAESMDLPYHPVRGLEEVEHALASALGERGPSVIEVDVDAFGPLPTPFTPPVRIPTA